MRGSHGTCRSRAESICSQGFRVDLAIPGRQGCGAYFWEHGANAKGLAKLLAFHWYECCFSRGDFLKDDDQRRAALFVEISDEVEMLNFAEPHVEQGWKEYYREAHQKSKAFITETERLKLREQYILFIEAEAEASIDVVRGFVRVPAKPDGTRGDSPIFVDDSQPILVARNPSVVSILEVLH